jgi:hypothetical protein
MDCWKKLGIEATSDKRVIKRAYAALIKKHNPEEDPRGFQAVREAYDEALQRAEYLAYEEHDRVANERSAAEAESDLAFPQVAQPAPAENSSIELQRSRIRDAQSETISAALAEFMRRLREDETASIEFCRSTLQTDFFQALDVRYEFEGRLLATLIEADHFSFSLFQYLAKEFDWNIDIRRREQMVVSHFEGDVRFAGVFYAAVRPYIFELVKKSVEDELQSVYPAITVDELSRVERLLFTEVSELELAEFCKHPRSRGWIASAHKFLVENDFITVRSSIVPQKTLDWLIQRNIVRDIKTNNVTSVQPQTSTDTESGFPKWVIWVVAVIAIRFIVAIGQEFSSSSNQPVESHPPVSSGYSDIYVSTPAQMGELEKLQRDAAIGNLQAQYELGMAFLNGERGLSKDPKKATEWLRRAADRKYPPAVGALPIAINEFAWKLSTHRSHHIRDGFLAVKLIEDALILVPGFESAQTLDTLAAAYAETGNFDQAVQIEQRALDKLPSNVDDRARRAFEARLRRYQNRESYIE